MNNALGQVVTVFTAIVGVAALAVLVSKNANTQNIIKESGNAFIGGIKAAVSPVSGGFGPQF